MSDPEPAAAPEPSDRVRLLLITSNGTGMGHLSRMLTVARSVADEADCTIMSLSLALPVVLSEGIPGEYCLGPSQVAVTPQIWEHYFAERVVALASELDADVIAFDGVAPYRGLLLASRQLPRTRFVWIRRGMWQPGVNAAQLSKAPLFDLVIEPGDLASAGDRGLTAGRSDALRVPPVSMLEVVEPLPRAEAAGALGLDPEIPAVLVTLGSGRLGEVAEPGRIIVDALLEHPGWQIAVTTAAIASARVDAVDDHRIVELRGVFPLVRYLRAFDAAVSAAGYNAVHELLLAGLPTLLVPNTATRTDDQQHRAEHLAGEGLAAVALPHSEKELRDGVAALMDEASRSRMVDRLTPLALDPTAGGGRAIGLRLVHEATVPRSVFKILATIPFRLKLGARVAAKALLGERGTNVVRRVLGRPIPPTPALVTGKLPELTEAISTSELRDGTIVEHVLAGSSGTYRASRQEIVRRFHGRGGARW